MSDSSAVISDCGIYRYSLYRKITEAEHPKICLFIMLNPSTADALKDDPTIRKCKSYAQAWGYDALEVINVYAYRATKPSDLPDEDVKRTGPDYFAYADAAIQNADIVVCGWGRNVDEATSQFMLAYIVGQGKSPYCLAINKGGTPKHPLYLKKDLSPTPFSL